MGDKPNANEKKSWNNNSFEINGQENNGPTERQSNTVVETKECDNNDNDSDHDDVFSLPPHFSISPLVKVRWHYTKQARNSMRLV